MDQDEDLRKGGAAGMGRQMMPQAGGHTSEEPRAVVVCNNSSTIFKYFNFFVGRAVVCAPQHTGVEIRGQSKGVRFSSPTTWDPGIKLGSPGLAAGTLSN